MSKHEIITKKLKPQSVKELRQQVNYLEAEIVSIEKKRTIGNMKQFLLEIYNLLDGVGDGFVEGDYYAPSRYYSKINGVKNLRIAYDENEIVVKITSPVGKLLPNKVNIRGLEYKVILWYSNNYTEQIDY